MMVSYMFGSMSCSFTEESQCPIGDFQRSNNVAKAQPHHASQWNDIWLQGKTFNL